MLLGKVGEGHFCNFKNVGTLSSPSHKNKSGKKKTEKLLEFLCEEPAMAMAMAQPHFSASLAGPYPCPASSFSGGSRSALGSSFFLFKLDLCHLHDHLPQWHHGHRHHRHHHRRLYHRRQCRHKQVACSSDQSVVAETAGRSKDAKSISDFIRCYENGEEEFHLQTATVSYRKPFPFSVLQPNLQVDLVSAVHIADKSYFADLQEKLAAYDRVLYEMVADKNPKQTNRNSRTRFRPPRRRPGGRRRNFSVFASIQRTIAYLLKLDFQLECMDYRMENWYHADLDYKTFSSLQRARGESLFTFARDMAVISLNTMARASMMPGNVDPWRARLLWASKALPMPLIGLFLIETVCAPPEAPLNRSPAVKALLDLDLSGAIKVLLAKQLATNFTEGVASMVEKSVIIGERNKAAIEELDEALNEGCKRVAIFYGGGHMPDMDARLREQFGLVATDVEWQTAWSIRSKRQASDGLFSDILSSLAKVSGWPLDRYQTSALTIFSLILAIDLWFWEVLLDALNKYCNDLIILVAQLLEKASQL